LRVGPNEECSRLSPRPGPALEACIPDPFKLDCECWLGNCDRGGAYTVPLRGLAESCWKGPLLEGVENSDSNDSAPSSMRINYLPMVCEHRQTATIATVGHGSTAHGTPLREGRPDVIPTDPSLVRPASRVETTPLEVMTAPVFRKQPRQVQTAPEERPLPNRAESGQRARRTGLTCNTT